MLNAVSEETSMKMKRVVALRSPPLARLQVRGVQVNISETTINRLLYGPSFITQVQTYLYNHQHHLVTSVENMSDLEERTQILWWIVQPIAIEGANVSWMTNPIKLITKAFLTFPAKFKWPVVHARL